MKIGTASAAASNNLRLFRTDIDLKISMLKKRSIYCIYQISKLTGFRRVDLHGLTLDEAYDLMIVILDHIYKMLNYNYQKKYSLVTQVRAGSRHRQRPALTR